MKNYRTEKETTFKFILASLYCVSGEDERIIGVFDTKKQALQTMEKVKEEKRIYIIKKFKLNKIYRDGIDL